MAGSHTWKGFIQTERQTDGQRKIERERGREGGREGERVNEMLTEWIFNLFIHDQLFFSFFFFHCSIPSAGCFTCQDEHNVLFSQPVSKRRVVHWPIARKQLCLCLSSKNGRQNMWNSERCVLRDCFKQRSLARQCLMGNWAPIGKCCHELAFCLERKIVENWMLIPLSCLSWRCPIEPRPRRFSVAKKPV